MNAPAQLPLVPLPTLVAVGQQPDPNDGHLMVVLHLQTPLGAAVYWLDGDAALQIGRQLRENGKAVKTGLILPPEPDVLRLPPNGAG